VLCGVCLFICLIGGLLLGEWWEVLIFPLFCIAMVYIIGLQFGLWDRVKGFLGSHGGGGVRGRFEGIAVSLKGIEFRGIANWFRKD
jgi:hypothetical protein